MTRCDPDMIDQGADDPPHCLDCSTTFDSTHAWLAHLERESPAVATPGPHDVPLWGP